MDGILKVLLGGGFLSMVLVAPNAVQVLDKPAASLLKKLDKRSREREVRRVVYYMKRRGLIKYATEDYEHGIALTETGKQYLKQRDFESLAIPRPTQWDKQWRLIFFDIPETQKSSRDRLTRKLRQLGFQQLQRSIWIHPFPCQVEIETVTETVGVRRFVTYLEISGIAAEEQLKERFATTLQG